MNRITNAQLISLLLIGDAFALFCLYGDISVMTAAGFAAGSIMQLFLALPLAYMYRRGKNLTDCGAIVRLAILAYILIWGGMLFSMLWKTRDIIYIPYESAGVLGQLAVAGLIALVCVYISSTGIKALARSGVIAAAMGALCIAIVIVSAVLQSDPANLMLPARESFLYEISRGFALSGGLGGFVVLLGFADGDKVRLTVYYFICKAAFSAAVIITAVLVTGGIMSITDFPAAAAAQLSQPFPVQRIDSLFLIVFSVFAVYSLAAQAAAAEYLIGSTLPALKKFRCASALAIMAAVGFLLGKETPDGAVYALAVTAALLIAPVSAALRKERREAYEIRDIPGGSGNASADRLRFRRKGQR